MLWHWYACELSYSCVACLCVCVCVCVFYSMCESFCTCMIHVPNFCCCLVETQVTATKIDRELRRVVWTKWKSHAVENSIKICLPTHPNPVQFPQKSFQHAPQILPKWSRKPPEHEERQVAATKARRLRKLVRFLHAIRSLLGSNWAPNLMKIRTKINVEKNMFYRLVFSWLGPHVGGVF